MPLLRHADLTDFAIGTAIVAAYYLVFVLGWMRILLAYGIRVPYQVALQSEMLSMLAKYIPGGVWTPTARVVALRRFGVKDTPVVLASILLEAGISAVAGVIVFVVGLVIIGGADVPLLPLAAFAVVVGFLLYPPCSARSRAGCCVHSVRTRWHRSRRERRSSCSASTRSPGRSAAPVSSSCCGRVGGDPAVSSIPYLGGVAAVGAIVAVLAVFAPSGLGVREASMYGLMLAVTTESVALGATVLNRLAITLVEAVLVLVGFVLLRGSRKPTVAGREVEGVPVAALPRDEVLRG